MRGALLLAALIVATGCVSRGQTATRLAIQPLGPMDRTVIETVKQGIGELYRLDITILPPVELPPESYYPPRSRYRADTLLGFLKTGRYREYDRVLGLTASDISATKGDIPDWGIFGLGSLDGKSCVVSTFRLGRGGSPSLFNRRLVKVVNHELGHTFGLPHCPVERCLMGDAKGTIDTVDRETGEPCGRCVKRLGELKVLRTRGGG